MEARALAHVAVVGLEDLGGGAASVYQLLDPAPVGLHDLVVELSTCASGSPSTSPRRAGGRGPGVVVGPAVVHQVDLDGPAQHDRLEVVHAVALPAGLEAAGKGGIGGPVAPLADGRRRAVEHVEVFAESARGGTHTGCRWPPYPRGRRPVPQSGQRLMGSPAGVSVVPPRRVERVPGEVLHALDVGSFRRFRMPTASMYQRQVTASPRSVSIRQRPGPPPTRRG